MEPIEVTVRFLPDGEIIPLSFRFRGHDYPVTSSGRVWQDDSGRHMLVMIPAGTVCELLLEPSGVWQMVSFGPIIQAM
jgi:hypothetical protein